MHYGASKYLIKDDTKDEISFWFRLKNEFPSL